MLLPHVQQRVLNQSLHFTLVQHVVVVGVVLLENEVHRLLNLISGIPQLVVLLIGSLLHVLAVQSTKRPLWLLERRVGSSRGRRISLQVRQVLRIEASQMAVAVGTQTTAALSAHFAVLSPWRLYLLLGVWRKHKNYLLCNVTGK